MLRRLGVITEYENPSLGSPGYSCLNPEVARLKAKQLPCVSAERIQRRPSGCLRGSACCCRLPGAAASCPAVVSARPGSPPALLPQCTAGRGVASGGCWVFPLRLLGCGAGAGGRPA